MRIRLPLQWPSTAAPRAARAAPALAKRSTRYLRYASFARYWDQLCNDYDGLGDFWFRAAPARRTTVPILVWVGDRDFFEPTKTRAHFARVTSRLDFSVMPGWAHDYGPDPAAGIKTVSERIARFLEVKPPVRR